MSTWCETPLTGGQRGAVLRSTVLRGSEAAQARPARMDSDLATSPFATSHVVDARLTDPHLQDVVATAKRKAIEQGAVEGHRAGYAAGMAVAAAEAHVAVEHAAHAAAAQDARRETQMQDALTVLGVAAEAFRQAEAASVAEIESVVTDLALSIARAVLERELVLSADPGREALTRALALAPRDCPAVARLHPDDVAVLGELGALVDGRSVVAVADPTVEPGGCIVDAGGRQIDAQVGPALERVAAVLQGKAQ